MGLLWFPYVPYFPYFLYFLYFLHLLFSIAHDHTHTILILVALQQQNVGQCLGQLQGHMSPMSRTRVILTTAHNAELGSRHITNSSAFFVWSGPRTPERKGRKNSTEEGGRGRKNSTDKMNISRSTQDTGLPPKPPKGKVEGGDSHAKHDW
jgi:hypothetical protein